MNTVLMVAFHFPPMSESSGYLRPLRFAQYLNRDHNWRPQVLSVAPHVYSRTSEEHLPWLDEHLTVRRAWSLDTQKHLSLKGRYLDIMACPDRWVTWYPFALALGMRMIRKDRPDVIWSTTPIATANLVAASLARLYRLPWIADFRDPLTTDDYPEGRWRWRSTRWVEKLTIERADKICFAADSTRKKYADRYPEHTAKFVTIPNGFDEIEHAVTDKPTPNSDKIVLLHAGAMFPDGRSPETLFTALKQLLDDGHPEARRISIRLRASGFDQEYAALARRLGVEHHVEFAPPLAYSEMRREMCEVNGLLLLQGPVYAHSIPAKAYEYLASHRPVLALVTPEGESRNVLAALDSPYIADIESPASVKTLLTQFLLDNASGNVFVAPEDLVAQFSRAAQTAKLHDVLKSVLAS